MDTRIALSACAVLCGALCGRALADAARRRANALRAIAEGLRVLRIHMTGMLEPVQNALERANCPLFTSVAEQMRTGMSADAAWRSLRQRALRRGGVCDALTQRDAQALDVLFERLGQSGREEQEALLDGAMADIERLREAAAKRAGEADRLYVSLGLLIGLMLALIAI